MSSVRKSLAMCFAVWCALLSACATSSAPNTPDLSFHRICPDSPQNCAGSCCGDACIDTTIDVRNCGGCNTQCPSGTVCAQGKCGCLPTGTPCGTGQSCCGNLGCKSLASDNNNCGACNNSCGTGSVCEAGVCKCNGQTCATGQSCCNGVCAQTCAGAPDMATAGACTCASGCPLSGVCVGPNCCLEDALIAKSCKPDATCLQSNP